MSKRVTMQDVADAAGVSKSTVSFILNGRDDLRISEQTKKKVWQVINYLNYRPNLYAKNLRGTLTNKVIAFYMSKELTELEKLIFFDYFYTAANILLESGQRAQLLLDIAKLDNVDAIIAGNLSKAKFYELADCNFIPLIADGCIINDPIFYEVNPDYAALKKLADQYLPDGYTYLCTHPFDDCLQGLMQEQFPKVQFVSHCEEINSLQDKSYFVTQPVLKKLVAAAGKEVFYPEGLTERRIRQLIDCAAKAVSREDNVQHSYIIT